jgi:hypothetical protein
VQLRRTQSAHLAHEAGHVTGENRVDQPAPSPGQRHRDETAVVEPARLRDEAAAHQVGHDHRRVAVAAQQLLAEVPLAERAAMQQGLQHAELPDRQSRPGHDPADPRGDGLDRPHQLDVGVQGRGLGHGPRVPRRHGSNSKRL